MDKKKVGDSRKVRSRAGERSQWKKKGGRNFHFLWGESEKPNALGRRLIGKSR